MWRSRRDFEGELIAKVWEDPQFKERLLKDPRSIVEELTGEKLPGELKVSVFQESPTEVCLVIPRNPDDPLTDDELTSVAGGVGSGDFSSLKDNVFTRF